MSKIKITQSLLKNFWKPDVCMKAIEFQHIKGKPIVRTEAMLAGLFFEYHLIGGTRGGQVPSFPPLKTGKPPKIEADLMELVAKAQIVMEAQNVSYECSQEEWNHPITKRREVSDAFELEGHPDLVGTIFRGKDKVKAILDVKWTGGRYDDKWMGWKGIEMQPDKHWQAKHYVYMYWKMTGKILPFFYLVFGKSGWSRTWKLSFQKETLKEHERVIWETMDEISERMMTGWEASPEYNKCQSCPFRAECLDASNAPLVEEIIF